MNKLLVPKEGGKIILSMHFKQRFHSKKDRNVEDSSEAEVSEEEVEEENLTVKRLNEVTKTMKVIKGNNGTPHKAVDEVGTQGPIINHGMEDLKNIATFVKNLVIILLIVGFETLPMKRKFI